MVTRHSNSCSLDSRLHGGSGYNGNYATLNDLSVTITIYQLMVAKISTSLTPVCSCIMPLVLILVGTTLHR